MNAQIQLSYLKYSVYILIKKRILFTMVIKTETPHAGNDISIVKLDLFFSLLMCKVNLSNLKHVITPASSESCLFIGPQRTRLVTE